MDLREYKECYLPGTQLYVAEAPGVVDGIPYDATGFENEENALYIKHEAQRTMHNIGTVIASRIQSRDTNLHILAEEYHPLFLEAVGDYLQLETITPYIIERPHSAPLLKKVRQETEPNQTSSTFFDRARNMVGNNPTLEMLLSLLESESI